MGRSGQDTSASGTCPAAAYVTSNLGVTPINTTTNKPGKLIKIPGGAGLIVITPG